MDKKFEETSFLAGADGPFMEALYERYLQDPGSVDESWQRFFATLGPRDSTPRPSAFKGSSIQGIPSLPSSSFSAPSSAHQGIVDLGALQDTVRVLQLIRSYRVRGHLKARLDPLALTPSPYYAELDPASCGFKSEDYDRPLFIGGLLGLQWTSLREILGVLEKQYCGSIGIEYLHIHTPEERTWLEQKIEAYEGALLPAQKRAILQSLGRASAFERFLKAKFPGAKRFGLEGGETMIPALETLLTVSGESGVREVVIGMAHRGRLNVLTNILGKPARALLSRFQGDHEEAFYMQGSGDVKYHLGSVGDRAFGNVILHLSLTSNPSHLEAVNPVVGGKVRAKQTRRGDKEQLEVMGLLIHGDAALAGQGMVSETLEMSDLKGYKTGGTLHFVVNNQIGFTTSPLSGRSSAYCTDIAKKIQAPIFHVNGDDPEAVIYVSQVAAEYRARFKGDVFVDMVCYRRYGHNEMDEPSFTQPRMYKAIQNHPPVFELYSEKLVQEGVISSELPQEILKRGEEELQGEFTAAPDYKEEKEDWLEGSWAGFQGGAEKEWDIPLTGVSQDVLAEIGRALTYIPPEINLHPRLSRWIQAKQEMFSSGENIDWATAEALALGALLCEGHGVRLSGQDSGRGTFSQRHAVLMDQETEVPYIPLNGIRVSQGELEVVDSPLSEAGVLGFEHGYSLADPHSLVIWEAQFGDFANGAQVIIDQFISPGEAKWRRLSGLVMLLPHGYEGQGPEHSSARLERYLQLCAEDNMQVANCSTPANYFHILRRQTVRQTRKPLILMTPKSLLRHRLAVSSLKDMETGTSFQPVYGEISPHIEASRVRRVVLCAGKVYYDLYEKREEANIQDIALLRVEQFYPFPEEALKQHLSLYSKAEIIWCQEEPANMGAWTFIDRRLEQILRALGGDYLRPTYVGRFPSASTATGLHDRHKREQAALVDQALRLKP